jgi:hypothetical protein
MEENAFRNCQQNGGARIQLALAVLVHQGAAVPGVISPDLTPLVDVRPQR